MIRLKTGDVCPLCGQPIASEDPFILGYLTAVRDVKKGPPLDSCEELADGLRGSGKRVASATDAGLRHLYFSQGWDDIMPYDEFKARFVEAGGLFKEKCGWTD